MQMKTRCVLKVRTGRDTKQKKFYGEDSPLLHDMMQIITDSAIAVINDSDNVKCYRELCENILQTDYPDKKAAANELHNICQTLLLG